ncbi:MAG: alkaline phosphatase family protein [Sedimentisphaerales bacterium]|nr:alkaline phosphatase family protein [Sedimentisphaerales bacterium]
MRRKKVVLIGIDGFPWKLFSEFISTDIMPNLGRMARNGVSGPLESVLPFETAPAWSSFQTGCHPGRTGIYTFQRYDRDQKRILLNSFNDIAVPSIWELANRSGKACICLNLPMTSPPPAIKGVIIPGLMCPELSPQTVYPSEVYDRYLKNRLDYRILDTNAPQLLKVFIDRHILTEQIRCQLGLELLTERDWDIFFIQIQSTDHTQHRVWSAFDRSISDFCEEYYQEANRLYRCCDDIIYKIASVVGNDALMVVLSDHGFTRLHATLYINTWLRQKGWLKLKSSVNRRSIWNKNKETLKKRIPPLKYLARIYGKLLPSQPAYLKPWHEQIMMQVDQVIDFQNTQVLALGSTANLIYLNNDSDHKKYCRMITSQLMADFGPDSSCFLIESVNEGCHVFGVKSDDSVPDLVIQFKEGVYGYIGPLGDQVVSYPKPTLTPFGGWGAHSKEGMYVICGPGINANKNIKANIVDIMPTILAYLNIPIPRHVEGSVLNDIFSQSISPCYEEIKLNQPRQRIEYSMEEQAAIEKKLGDLGYL